MLCLLVFFFFNDTATTEIYTLSLHDALPISARGFAPAPRRPVRTARVARRSLAPACGRARSRGSGGGGGRETPSALARAATAGRPRRRAGTATAPRRAAGPARGGRPAASRPARGPPRGPPDRSSPARAACGAPGGG